jgi:hypothetical protein
LAEEKWGASLIVVWHGRYATLVLMLADAMLMQIRQYDLFCFSVWFWFWISVVTGSGFVGGYLLLGYWGI